MDWIGDFMECLIDGCENKIYVSSKWESYITINKKRKHLGLFNLSELAAFAYDRAVPDNRPRNFSRKEK